MAERSSVASPDAMFPARRRLGCEPETGAGGHPASIKVVQPQGGLAAKRGLVNAVGQEIIEMNSRGVVPLLLNLGAGSDVSIENQLRRAGATRFVVDRVDLELTVVEQANVRRQWQGNIEDPSEITSDSYDLAFANYVIEHVKHVGRAIGEMGRVVRPGGLIVLTVRGNRRKATTKLLLCGRCLVVT